MPFLWKNIRESGNQPLFKNPFTGKVERERCEKRKSYPVKVETDLRWESIGYFLSLWVDGKTKMEDIDMFLRNIWLECCKHMSAFRNPAVKQQGGWDLFETMILMEQGKTKEYKKLIGKSNGEILMSRKVDEVFHK